MNSKALHLDSDDSLDSPQHHQRVVQESWQRCESFGLHPQDQPRQPDSAGATQALLEQHQSLIDTTHQQVLPYYENILSNTNSLVVLADNDGNVLQSWGDRRFVARRMTRSFEPGYNWKERWVGTNAIGTALATQAVVEINRDEHFLLSNRFISGSAAPIFDSERRMVGVIDVSSDAYVSQRHTTGMVKMMTQSIENRLLLARYADDYFTMTFNSNLDTVQSQWSGMIVFTEDGIVISANRRAQRIITEELALKSVEALFGVRARTLVDQPENTPICLSVLGRYRIYAVVRQPSRPRVQPVDFRLSSAETRSPSPVRHRVLDLSTLDTGDPRLAKAIRQVRKVLDKDIPILIRGETGVGKEWFVKALHASSARSAQPLVAVNCAAIPADLVESELFGYEKGAFTGANSKGAIGLIRQANGGILFLDEVGDMPLPLQARLLRVLQERKVTPLGGVQSYAVDIKLVSATHRSLRDQVTRGEFREDIYYRISGLNIELPALRERQDKRTLFQQVLDWNRDDEGAESYSPQVLKLFEQHSWPGNIRQLVNTVRIAAAMASGTMIEEEDLPEDFFEDLHAASEPTSDEVVRILPHRKDDEKAPIPQLADGISERIAYLNPKNPVDVRTALDAYQGNISKTAEALGISRNTLYKRIRESGG